MAVTTNY